MVRACLNCGRKNRIGAAHLARTVRCGQCKSPITAIAEPIDADETLFDDVIQHAEVPILVDFWAAWCGPCRITAPDVARTAAALVGRAVVLKVDTEKHPQLSARFQVRSIPNFIIFKNARLVQQQSGIASADELIHRVEAVI